MVTGNQKEEYLTYKPVKYERVEKISKKSKKNSFIVYTKWA